VPGSFRPRRDILPPAQDALWAALAPVAGQGFVLYGGTAIALRLGHRASIDFDFFSDRPLHQQRLRRALPLLDTSTTLQESPDSLTVITPAATEPSTGVKISFFGAIDFGRVGTPDTTDDGIMQVASLADLMATKLKVILQRIEAKDYLDIAAMLASGAELAHGLAAAKALFGPSFQPSECLKALTWFQGGDLADLPDATRITLANAASRTRDLPLVHVIAQELSATA